MLLSSRHAGVIGRHRGQLAANGHQHLSETDRWVDGATDGPPSCSRRGMRGEKLIPPITNTFMSQE
jgi:hypothetical protein